MEENDIEKLSEKTGGRFNLVTLYCRRLRDLQRGLPALVEEAEGLTHKEIVVEEIKQGKVWLLVDEEALEFRGVRMKKAARELPPEPTEEEKAARPPVR